MVIYIGYAIGACALAFGLGAFAALGWQLALQLPKIRNYKLQVVRK